MLRNMNQSVGGKHICGTPNSGLPAGLIPIGFSPPSLLENDIDVLDPVDCEYRVFITSIPVGLSFQVNEDGTYIANAVDGTYTGGQEVYKNGVAQGPTTYTFYIGTTPSIDINFSASYQVLSFVNSTLAANYAVLNSVTSPISGAYTIVSPVDANLSAAYNVLSIVNQDFAAIYSISELISSDLVGSYAANSFVNISLFGSYSVDTPYEVISSNFAGSYSIESLIDFDLGGNYSVFAPPTYRQYPLRDAKQIYPLSPEGLAMRGIELP